MPQNPKKVFSFSELMKKITGSKKKTSILVGVGITGIVLILLSEMITPPKQTQTQTVQQNTNETYVTAMETKLTDLIGSIEGVGETKVMVTLEHGTEKLYARETKNTQDKTQDFDGTDTKKIQERVNSEDKYILVEGESGNREALVSTQVEPKVKGVVIVCAGADDIKVQARVTEAVTTILGIQANQVCVTKSI